jgi:hypothetical protein
MSLGRIVRKGPAGVLAVALVAGLTGCVPPSTGYVVNPGGGEPLELRSVCDDEWFSAVTVRYVINGDPSAFEAQEPIWSVEFPEGSEPGIVKLFEDNPGGTAQFGQGDIDWDRDMSVIWDGNGSLLGLGGNLGDLAPGNVIWNAGKVEALDVFELMVPDRGFGC